MSPLTAAPGIPAGNQLVRRLIMLGLLLLFLAAVVMLLPLIGDILSALIMSLVISYAMQPVLLWMERNGIQRIVAILLLFLLITALLVLAVVYLSPRLLDQLSAFGNTLGKIDLQHLLDAGFLWINSHIPQLGAYLGEGESGSALIMAKLHGLFASLIERSAASLGKLVNAVSLLSIMPILIFFMLKDGGRFTHSVVARVPNRFFEMALSLVYRINRTIGDYIVSVILSSLFIAVSTSIGLYVAGVQYALALGLLAGLFNLIPFFGPLIAMIVVFVVIMLTETAVFWPLVWAAIVLISLQQLESFVVRPALLSRTLDVHPAVVIIVVLIGGRLAGGIGMFIAVPVYSILHLFVVDLYGHLKEYRII